MGFRSLLQKLKTDEKGMTLVEIMVSFALLMLVLTLSLSIMTFGSKVLVKDSDKDRLKMVGDSMYEQLIQNLTFATHVKLLPEGSSLAEAPYENIILVQDGRLLFGTKDSVSAAYPDNAYQNTALTMEAEVSGDAVLTLTLRFMDHGDALYTGTSSLQVINLAAGTDAETIEGSGGTNNVISYDGEAYSIKEGYVPEPPKPSEPAEPAEPPKQPESPDSGT